MLGKRVNCRLWGPGRYRHALATALARGEIRRSGRGRFVIEEEAPVAVTPGMIPSLGRMRISVLDQSPISEGSTGVDALANTLDLARLTDSLGYHRYWLAEHHGGPSLAGPSPEALIGPVAAATSRIRVGSGGVMLPHYSPFKVAETFSVLAGLFPGRIDLGIGRAAGHRPDDDLRAPARPDTGGARRLPPATGGVARALRRRLPPDHPFARLGSTLPGGEEQPDLWLLGSSPQSAIWAAQLGLPYAFADFINPEGETIAAQYHQDFSRPSASRHRG